jgi:hypothetical protein
MLHVLLPQKKIDKMPPPQKAYSCVLRKKKLIGADDIPPIISLEKQKRSKSFDFYILSFYLDTPSQPHHAAFRGHGNTYGSSAL